MREREMRTGLLAASLIAATLASPARAGLTELDVFKTVAQTQTGPATFSPSTYAYDARLFFSNPGEYTTGSVVGASTGPAFSLTLSGPTTLSSGSIGVANQAALNAAFPADTYTVSGSGGTAGNSVFTVTNPPGNNAFPQSTAGFTASTFSALQGLDSSQSINLNLLSFTPATKATESDIFLTIIDSSTQAIVFNQGFLPSTTTSILLAGGTLHAGTTYHFDLDYSDRSFPGPGQALVTGFDNRTGGTFTTAAAAVPEPSSLAMLGLGVAALLARSRLRGLAPAIGRRVPS